MNGVTNPAEEYFKDGTWSWNGSVWVKDNLPFGYRDRWAEQIGGTKSGDGAWYAATAAVPAGYVYVAQFMFLRNSSGARGARYFAFKSGASSFFVGYTLTPAINIPDIWSGAVLLKEGDTIYMYQSSCLDGDVILAGAWGYKMKVT